MITVISLRPLQVEPSSWLTAPGVLSTGRQAPLGLRHCQGSTLLLIRLGFFCLGMLRQLRDPPERAGELKVVECRPPKCDELWRIGGQMGGTMKDEWTDTFHIPRPTAKAF